MSVCMWTPTPSPTTDTPTARLTSWPVVGSRTYIDVPEGFDQAVRRAVRKSVERAGEWNAENPDAITPRLEDADAYRVVVVRVNVDR